MADRYGDLETHELHPQSSSLLSQDHLPTHVTSTPSSRPGNASTAYLNGLRGLAALFVFIQHYIGAFDANVHEHGFGQDGNWYFASLPYIRLVTSGGSAAVAIFFVLSGYVLSKGPLRQCRDGKVATCKASLVSAVVRRPFRLYLPVLGVTFLTALLMHAPWGIMPDVPWPKARESVGAELANWVEESVRFFNPFRTHGSSGQAWYTYNLVAWTIPIELKGSMLTYALVGVYAYSGLSVRKALGVMGAATAVMLQFGYWTMACFIFGVGLSLVDLHAVDTGLLERKLSARARGMLWFVLFLLGGYLLSQPAHSGKREYSSNTPGWGLLSYLTPPVYDDDQYYRYWHSWGALMLVYSCLRISWLQNFLHRRPLRYLGKVSFLLYLVHLPLIRMLGERLALFFGHVFMGAKESWWNNRLWIPDFGPAGLSSRTLLCLSIMLALCLVVSDFATRTLDTPSVRLAKRIVQKLGIEKDRGKGEANGGAMNGRHALLG